MAEKDIEYYRNLTERAGRDFVSRQKEDPFKTVSLPSEAFKRYEGLNVLASDVYGGKEIDNRYSLTQGFLDRTGRDLKVFGANAASMFASTIVSLPDLLFNYDNEKSFIENMGDTPMVKSIFEWRKDIEEGNINFNTAVDDETGTWSTIKNTVLPGWYTGSSKGWGELFRSAGYSVGVMGSMFLPSPGTVLANVARLTGVARGVGKFASLTNQVVSKLNSPAILRNSSALIDDIVNTSKALNNAANTVEGLNKMKDVAKFMHRGLMGAYGEAAFEGLESEQAVLDDLTKDFIEKHGYTPYGKDLENIKGIAKEARTASFWMNMSMLTFSNAFQMGRLFRHIDAQKETVEALARRGLKFEVVDGKPQVMSRTLQSDWFQKGFGKKIEPVARGLKSLGSPRGIFIESLSEGLEEFSQEAFANAVNSYAQMRYNTNGKKGVWEAVSFIGQGLKDSMTDEGLRSFLSGVMVGGGQQLIQSAITLPSQMRNKGHFRDELNKTLAQYGEFDVEKVAKYMNVDSIRGTIIDKVFDTQAAKNIGDAMDVTTDAKTYKDLEDANFFNLSKPYLMRGHAEVLKQQFKYAVENYEGDISELFNTKSSKQDVINSFNKKIDGIAQSYQFISNTFRNPYNPNASEEEAINAGLFNNGFVPEMAYQHWRLGRLQERKTSLESELGGLYEEFKNTTGEKTLPKLEKQIEKRIKDISEGAATSQTTAAKRFYEKSLEQLKEFKELIKDEKVDNNVRREKYGTFMDFYMNGVYSYLGTKPNSFSIDDFQQKTEDVTRIALDIELIEKNISQYLSGDYFNLVKENYIKATRDFLEWTELERIEKVFGSIDNYKKYADEKYKQYVEEDIIDEDVFSELIRSAKGTEEELTKQVQELANKEIDRRLEVENYVSDWMKKLSHLKSETLSQDILDIITKHASNKKRPELTKEVREKIEEELKAKLPLKKEETSDSGESKTKTSSSNTAQTPSDIEAQIADIERRSGESVKDFINRLFENNYLVEVDGKQFFSLTQGRWGVVVNINGVKVPFYQSTSGTDTKIVGQWYPFFGDLGNWLIKGDSNDSNIGYGFKAIQDVQSFLNKNIKERDAIATSGLIPSVVNQNKDDLRKLDEDKIKGNEKISLNREATAKRLSELLGYTVEEGRKTKSDAELFALASKKVFSELAALESKTTTSSGKVPSDIESKKADIERRRQEKLKDFKVGSKLHFYGSTNTLDGEGTIVGETEKIFNVVYSDGRKMNLRKGQDEGLIQPNKIYGKRYTVLANENEINAEYDAEYVDAVKKGEMTKEQAMQFLEEVGRKDSNAYTEIAALEDERGEIKMISPEEMKKLRDEKRHLESLLEVEEFSQEEEESIVKRIDEITAIIVEQSKLYYNKGVNYNEFKSAINKIKEENSLDEVLNHDDIQLIPKNSISLWEIFNKTEFDKLSDPIKVDLLNVFKNHFTAWENEADVILNELKKNEPEIINFLGHKISKFSDSEYILTIGDEKFTFPSFNDALVKIAQEGISEIEEEVSDIQNKFENRSWYPIPSEDLTKEEKEREDSEQRDAMKTLNEMSLNMSEEDLMSTIGENTTVEYWGFDSTNPEFQLDKKKYGNKYSRLPGEKIIGSSVTDTIRLRYNKDGISFGYQSYKHPINSIRFFDKKHILNEIQNGVKSENLRNTLIILLEDSRYDIEGVTYYQFLLDASVEGSNAKALYELFQIAGFLRFKGSIQEQLNIIEEKQKIFDTLKNTKNINSEFTLKRIFDALETDGKKQRHNVPIEEIEHPFVMKESEGITNSDFVFFRFPDEVTSSQKFNVNYINPKYRGNNTHETALIARSVEAHLKKMPKLYSGYYILFTSSTGNPYIIRLSTKSVDSGRLDEVLNDESLNKLDKLKSFTLLDSSYLTGNSQSRAMYFNESGGYVYYNIKYFDEDGVEFSHSRTVPDGALKNSSDFKTWVDSVNTRLRTGKAEWNKKLPDGTWVKQNTDGTPILKSVSAQFIIIEGGAAKVPQSNNEVFDRYNLSQIGIRQFRVDKFVLTPKGKEGNKLNINLAPKKIESPVTPTPPPPVSSFFENTSSGTEYKRLVEKTLSDAKNINSNITLYDAEYITNWLEINFPDEQNKDILTTFVIYGLVGNLDKNANIPEELNNNIDKGKFIKAANSPAFIISTNINNAFQTGKIPLELTVSGTHYKNTPPTTSVEIDVTKEVDYLLSKCS